MVVNGPRDSEPSRGDDDVGGRGATRAESGVTSVANGNGPRGSGPSQREDVVGGRGATRAESGTMPIADGNGPRGSGTSRVIMLQGRARCHPRRR